MIISCEEAWTGQVRAASKVTGQLNDPQEPAAR